MTLEIIAHQPDGAARAHPLLFVHGAWHGAWCWDEFFLPYFAQQGYQVYALSLRGHGGSGGNLRWARIRDYVADVAQVVQSLPAPPVLIGHSMGGFVVQKYLEQNSVPGAVLLASVPTHGAVMAALRIMRYDPLAFAKVNLTLNLQPLMATPAQAQHHLFADDMPAEQVARYHARLNGESFLMFLDMLMLALPRPRRVKAPLLVLGGAADTIFAPWEVQRTARAYGTQATIFPAMAHDMMLEKDWQAVADTILTWLAALA